MTTQFQMFRNHYSHSEPPRTGYYMQETICKELYWWLLQVFCCLSGFYIIAGSELCKYMVIIKEKTQMQSQKHCTKIKSYIKDLFSICDQIPSYPQFPADLVTFTEEIFNGKLNFLCSEIFVTRKIHDSFDHFLILFSNKP